MKIFSIISKTKIIYILLLLCEIKASVYSYEEMLKNDIIGLQSLEDHYISLSYEERYQWDKDFGNKSQNAYAELSDGTIVEKKNNNLISTGPSAHLIFSSLKQNQIFHRKMNNALFVQLISEAKQDIKFVYFTMTLQESINHIVAKTAESVYQSINTNWNFPSEDEDYTTESQYWKIKKNLIERNYKIITSTEGSYTQDSFGYKAVPILQTNNPLDFGQAVQDLTQCYATLECLIAIKVVQIICLKEIMGKYFDKYAKILYFYLKEQEDEKFFLEFPNFFVTHHQQVSPGNTTYIYNLPSYNRFKTGQAGQGENVVGVSQDNFIGFGTIFKTGPQTLEAVGERLRFLFCKNSDVKYFPEEHAQIAEKYQDLSVFMKDFYATQQFSANNNYYIDAEKILTFIKDTQHLQ